MKIAILGNLETVKGFKTLGIDIFGIRDFNEAKNALNSIYFQEEYALLLLTEDWFLELRSLIKEFESRPLPALIVIPSIGSTTSIAELDLKQIVERAVGSDIFSEK